MTPEQAIERANKIITTKFNNDYSIDNVDKEAIEIILSMLEEKNKQIDLMAEELVHYKVINDPDFDNLKETFDKLVENEKQYFENEVKEVQ